MKMIEIMRHALGRDDEAGTRRSGKDWRNYFVAGGEDVDVCREAAKLGLMAEYMPISCGSPLFRVTDAGKALVNRFEDLHPALLEAVEGYLFAKLAIGEDLERRTQDAAALIAEAEGIAGLTGDRKEGNVKP